MASIQNAIKEDLKKLEEQKYYVSEIVAEPDLKTVTKEKFNDLMSKNRVFVAFTDNTEEYKETQIALEMFAMRLGLYGIAVASLFTDYLFYLNPAGWVQLFVAFQALLSIILAGLSIRSIKCIRAIRSNKNRLVQLYGPTVWKK